LAFCTALTKNLLVFRKLEVAISIEKKQKLAILGRFSSMHAESPKRNTIEESNHNSWIAVISSTKISKTSTRFADLKKT
jgi:hypothetical protein